MTPNIIKVSDLSNSNTAEAFSLFHANIRSLTKQFSELCPLINLTRIPFDIIGITESKQTISMDFALNVNMDGYNIHTQPTKSSHSGIAVYLKKSLDYTIRDDLSVVMSTKHVGLRLIQDQKQKTFFVAVLTTPKH